MRFFDAAKYGIRLEKAKEAMHRQGLEVLLVTDPVNINYLTG